ncbi:hypothetical protein J4377_04670 [Halomonas sp. XH26]|uniref:hypothetical protein n=1 Tax=Halomonas sp. XH26 TaxID=2557993 RepID=UPI0020A167CE|nr:hypothetical protein [Halomonas sp. XH26]UTA80782.1 hypothetical protein J4377_04670 [Halomonas sp. XH26]
MENQKIYPHKVTKPIQLLAAWLVGLVLVNGSLLATSSAFNEPVWLKATLIIAAICNVPLFIGAIFLLQTKFRPELQEDSYYSKYLDKSTSEYVTLSKDDELISLVSDLRSEVVRIEKEAIASTHKQPEESLSESPWHPWGVALCDLLPDFQDIRRELKKNEIPIDHIFGKANTNKKLKANVLSFSEEMDFASIVKVLRMMHPFSFEGYCYSVTPSSVNKEEIYLGGFGYLNGGFYPINKELQELLETDLEPSDLKYFESQNPKIVIHNKSMQPTANASAD